MTNFYRTLFSRCFSLVLGCLIIVQGFISSSYEVEHLSKNAVHEESFPDVLIGLLDWGYPDENERSGTEHFPECESEPEKEKSGNEDSKFHEFAEQGHNSPRYLPEPQTFNDIRALNSGSGKIPTPPPEVLGYFS